MKSSLIKSCLIRSSVIKSVWLSQVWLSQVWLNQVRLSPVWFNKRKSWMICSLNSPRWPIRREPLYEHSNRTSNYQKHVELTISHENRNISILERFKRIVFFLRFANARQAFLTRILTFVIKFDTEPLYFFWSKLNCHEPLINFCQKYCIFLIFTNARQAFLTRILAFVFKFDTEPLCFSDQNSIVTSYVSSSVKSIVFFWNLQTPVKLFSRES